jgi:predicted GNAT family acetyltransferase
VVIVTENDPRVVDNPEAGRFEVLVDGDVAGFAEYQRTKSAVAFTHTVIDPGFEGRHPRGRVAGAAVLPVHPRLHPAPPGLPGSRA